MGAKLIFTCNAVLPIVLSILTGYFLKCAKILPRDFFPLLNKLCFRCFLPCLLFFNVYNVRSVKEIANYGTVVLFALSSILIFFFLGILISIFSTKKAEQRGVMLQASFRSNYAIIGLSLALSISSDEKTAAIASVLSAVSIPLFNVLATIALTMFQKKEGSSILDVFGKIAKNPLILGCFSGICVIALREILPLSSSGEPIFSIRSNLPFVYKTLQMLASSASPVALVALGGNFEFSAVSKLKKLISIGVFARLFACPAICLFAAYKAGFGTHEFPALIALYGTPIAVSSVPMAAEMHGDAELAGQLVVWTSLFSALTLFISIFLCAQIGIFTV